MCLECAVFQFYEVFMVRLHYMQIIGFRRFVTVKCWNFCTWKWRASMHFAIVGNATYVIYVLNILYSKSVLGN